CQIRSTGLAIAIGREDRRAHSHLSGTFRRRSSMPSGQNKRHDFVEMTHAACAKRAWPTNIRPWNPPPMIAARALALALLLLLGASVATARERATRRGGERTLPERGRQEQTGPGVLSPLPPASVTKHPLDTPDGTLAYPATAGTFSLFDQ